jgi:hypothetical protein
MRSQFLIKLVMALGIFSTHVSGQGLEAKLAGARLPYTLVWSSAVYDGVGNVYLFGR